MFSPPPLVWSSSSNGSNVNDCKYDRQQILSWIYIFGFKDPVARKLRSYERDLDGDALEYVYTAFKVQEYERANMFIELKLPTAKSVPLMELLVFKCQLLLSAGNVENARLFSKMLIGEAEAWMGNYLTRATGEAFIVAGTLIGYKCDVLSNSPVDYVFFAKEYSRNEDVLFFIAHYHLTRSEIYLGEVYFKKLKKMCPNHPNVPFFKEMVKIGLDGKMPTLETFDSITNLIRSVHNGLNDYAIYQMYVFLMIFRDKLKADGLEEYLTVETEADNLLSMLRKLEEIDIADPKKYVHTFYAISLEIMSTSLINVKL
uniref:Nuclear pore protein n=1 Tax=Rhabditophanes sp. KR3021 TaxID=114890 RepID=A0AC35TW88_9BILA